MNWSERFTLYIGNNPHCGEMQLRYRSLAQTFSCEMNDLYRTGRDVAATAVWITDFE
jgi:hypothetical protein